MNVQVINEILIKLYKTWESGRRWCTYIQNPLHLVKDVYVINAKLWIFKLVIFLGYKFFNFFQMLNSLNASIFQVSNFCTQYFYYIIQLCLLYNFNDIKMCHSFYQFHFQLLFLFSFLESFFSSFINFYKIIVSKITMLQVHD